jgi:hypothetical protein
MWEALFAFAIAAFLIFTGAAIVADKMQDQSRESQV